MLDFLPLSFPSASHRRPVSGANSYTLDEIPDFSLFEHGTYDATVTPPVADVASPGKSHQADFTTGTAPRRPSSLFTEFGKFNHLNQFSPRNSYLSSFGKQTRSLPSSFSVARKGLGTKREARETLKDGPQSESEPINCGIEAAQPKQKMDSTEPPISSLTRRPVGVRKLSIQLTTEPSSSTRPVPIHRDTSVQQSSSSDHPSHDFSDLNIQATLFPTGLADPYSPAAYNRLAQKAEQLLSRFQAAYKDCKSSLREITAEKETQSEELEACQMRARHLQMQLDQMTTKFVEQDQAMMKLVDELAREKYLQQQQQQQLHPRTPNWGVKPTTTGRADPMHKNAPKASKPIEARRGSDLSTLSIISDSGFESDEESLIDRTGVKHRDASSPSASVSSLSTTDSRDFTRTANLPPPAISYPIASAQPSRPKAPLVWTPSLFPSAVKNAAPPLTLRDPFSTSCTNCQGARASEAWNVVSVLQEENRGLKERLGHLEGSLDECLDLVRMMGGMGKVTR